jgi:hypothetical protein
LDNDGGPRKMPPRSKPTKPKLTANVSLHRNGLVVEVPNVLLEDAAQMAATLLDAMRDLAKHYPEVVAELGSIHSGALGEVAPDAEYEEAKKRVGFHAR